MIVGHSNREQSVCCIECWRQLAQAGEHPLRILDSEDPNDPKNNFWIVDNCQLRGVEVKSLSSRDLD
jgi:hypothetical protein